LRCPRGGRTRTLYGTLTCVAGLFATGLVTRGDSIRVLRIVVFGVSLQARPEIFDELLEKGLGIGSLAIGPIDIRGIFFVCGILLVSCVVPCDTSTAQRVPHLRMRCAAQQALQKPCECIPILGL